MDVKLRSWIYVNKFIYRLGMSSVRIVGNKLTLIPHSIEQPQARIDCPLKHRPEYVVEHGTVYDVANIIYPLVINFNIVSV